jgi:hypothetical protein
MTGLNRLVLAGLLVAVLAAPAAGQGSSEGRVSVFGSLGFGELVDDEGSIGSGVDVGAGVGVRLGRSLALDLAVERLAHDRPTGFLSWDGHALRVMGRARYHFRQPAATLRPFVGGGLGVMRSTGEVIERVSAPFGRDAGEIVDRREWDFTGLAWEGGGGVEIAIGSAFLRPEAYWTVGELDRGARFGIPEPPYIILRFGVAGGMRF